MPILDRDGKPYRLRGPNPLLTEQDHWDTHRTTLLNFEDVDVIILKDDRPQPSVRKVEEIEELAEVILAEEEELLTVMEAEEEPQPVNNEIDQLLNEKAIPILCMPVIGQTTHKNDMGESYISYEYGQETSLRGIILSDNDIQMLFWSNIELAAGSVVFPRNADKRCWRITRREEKTGGYLHECFPSHVQPVFKGQPQR